MSILRLAFHQLLILNKACLLLVIAHSGVRGPLYLAKRARCSLLLAAVLKHKSKKVIDGSFAYANSS